MRLFWYGVVCTFATGCLLGLLVSGAVRPGTAVPIAWEPPAKAVPSSSTPNALPQQRAEDVPPQQKAEAVPEAEWQELELVEAEHQGLVHLEARGAGLLGVLLHLQGLAPTPMRLVVEAGTVFNPINAPNVQSMVIVRRTVLSLPAYGRLQPEVAAACINMHLDTPKSGHRMRLSSVTVSRDLARLLAVPGFFEESADVRQYAIWTVTDNPARGEYMSLSVQQGPLPFMTVERMGSTTRSRIAEWFSRAGIDAERYEVFREEDTDSKANWKDLAERLADESPSVRCRALATLVKMPRSERGASLLAERLADTGQVQRGSRLYQDSWQSLESPMRIGHVAAGVLAEWGYWRWLIEAVTSRDVALRAHAASGLAKASADCEPSLIAVAGDPSADVRVAVAWSLPGVIRTRLSVSGDRLNSRELAVLGALLTDRDVEVRRTVVQRLVHSGFAQVPAARGLAAPMMEVLERDQWREAAYFLGQVKAAEAVPLLISINQADDMDLRRAAINALGAIGTEAAEDALREIVDTPTDNPTRGVEQVSAKQSLERIARDRAKSGRGR